MENSWCVWKNLKEVGIPDHLTCLLRNLYVVQEATVRTRHGTWTGSKLGKEYTKAVYCYPAYLTGMARLPFVCVVALYEPSGLPVWSSFRHQIGPGSGPVSHLPLRGRGSPSPPTM